MNRAQISRLAHAGHPIAAPLDDESVRLLLDGLLPREEARVLDLGCGGAEWLLRALAMRPLLRAEGVDVAAEALDRARDAAHAQGVRDRLLLHRADAAAFTCERPFDAVLSVGATHAFGGLRATLAAARRHLAPGGRLLIGDGFWENTPSAEAVEMLGDLGDLPAVLDTVAAEGWTPVGGHISSRRELDAYEWAWTGSLASWALDRPGDPDSAQALATAAEHREGWLHGYRDSFGFVCLVLRPSSG
ncbi:SAM-dependent methyltransferase [Streptomyces sp. NPDC057197]|uniref:SAM-dependent methyltransferase n=1 Tax=Streptomyces sp. NPDC057197 TaxID=3346045 RepID=UPI00363630E1